MSFEVVDGGLVCSTEEVEENNDDCYIVNAAVYVLLATRPLGFSVPSSTD